jgi:hypothetical protein
MKLTLIGKPAGQVTQHDTYVAFPMSGTPPQSMPGGLPALPGPPLVWTVWLSLKQWNRVKGTLNQADEKLILEGYPCQRGTEHILVVQGCQSLLQQRARQQAQKDASAAQAVS